MSEKKPVVAVHVWFDGPAASHLGAAEYYSVSEVDEDGEEVRCIGGSRYRGDAWDLGVAHASDLGVPCVEYAVDGGQATDRWNPPENAA